MTICSLFSNTGKCWRTLVPFVNLLPSPRFPSSTFSADRDCKAENLFFFDFSLIPPHHEKHGGNLCLPGSNAIIVTTWNASHFSLRLRLSGRFIIYCSAPFDGNASAVQLDYQMVESNLAHLNVFAALPLGCVTQLGAGTFLLFNQPTEATQLRDKQKVKMTLHHDSQF